MLTFIHLLGVKENVIVADFEKYIILPFKI